MSRIVAMIMASGSSSRMQGPNKLLLPYAGSSVIESVVDRFLAQALIDEVLIVTSDPAIMERLAAKPIRIVGGGTERSDSVINGLETLQPSDFVLIHDGARPLISNQLIEQCIGLAQQSQAFVLAVPVTDTLKRVDQGWVIDTPDRSQYWAAQTPQGALVQPLLEAYLQAKAAGIRLTDDASALEWAGHPVQVIPGDYANQKLTTPADMRLLCESDKE